MELKPLAFVLTQVVDEAADQCIEKTTAYTRASNVRHLQAIGITLPQNAYSNLG
jgi:hypothetical protein